MRMGSCVLELFLLVFSMSGGFHRADANVLTHDEDMAKFYECSEALHTCGEPVTQLLREGGLELDNIFFKSLPLNQTEICKILNDTEETAAILFRLKTCAQNTIVNSDNCDGLTAMYRAYLDYVLTVFVHLESYCYTECQDIEEKLDAPKHCFALGMNATAEDTDIEEFCARFDATDVFKTCMREKSGCCPLSTGRVSSLLAAFLARHGDMREECPAILTSLNDLCEPRNKTTTTRKDPGKTAGQESIMVSVWHGLLMGTCALFSLLCPT